MVVAGSKRKMLIIGLSIALAVVVVANLTIGYFLLRPAPTAVSDSPPTRQITLGF